jgi:hypothetical protein
MRATRHGALIPLDLIILIIICTSGFLNFVHRLYFNKITTFRKLDLLPYSGKKGRTETLAVGPPGWASLRPRQGLMLAQQDIKGRTETLAVGPPGWANLRSWRGLRLGFLSFLFLPEDGRRSSFRNVAILLKYRRWTKSKNLFYIL